MKQNQSTLQKFGGVLSTSSETFMLIALVSLFSLPFVIAKNVEPSVKQAEKDAQRTAVTTVIRDERTAQLDTDSNLQASQGSAVLGAQTSVNPFEVVTNDANLKFFEKSTPVVAEKAFSLDVNSTQVYGTISLFKVKNNSAEKRVYRFNAVDLANNDSAKYLYVDNVKYLINSNKLPEYVSVEPNSEVLFSINNSETSSATNLKVTVELVDKLDM